MATEAHYDPASGNVFVRLSIGIGIFFSPDDVEALQGATPAQLKEIEITPSGLGIHFPKLDEGINVPNLLDGLTGTRKWMAARLGAQGGKARSLAKRTAARANGALGGRPRKSAIR
ncbi:MAG TPA: DUF2442 domain-containing protein [Acidobacteriaceae bacterium]